MHGGVEEAAVAVVVVVVEVAVAAVEEDRDQMEGGKTRHSIDCPAGIQVCLEVDSKTWLRS